MAKKSNSKRGLSGVVATVILIAMTIVAVSILWVFIQGMFTEQLDSAKSCFDIFEKIKINSEYSCYDSSNNELRVLIELTNIKPDKLIISVSDDTGSKSFIIEDGITSENIKRFAGNYNEEINLPAEHSGINYVFKLDSVGITKNPRSVRIAPVIGGETCEIIDSNFNIVNCDNLA
jgi:flagellin-like protein